MSDAGEIQHPNDYVMITVDIDDCPLVEVPPSELFDIATSTVIEDYLNVLQAYVYGCVCLIAVLNPRYNTAVLYHPFFPCILNCIIETPIWVKGLL